MFRVLAVMLLSAMTMQASDLPSKKYLNLAAIKTMVAASEAKAKELNVEVTICIVDESGNLLFLQKADGAALTTIQFAQRKARQAALYRKPSKSAQDALTGGGEEGSTFGGNRSGHQAAFCAPRGRMPSRWQIANTRSARFMV